MMDIPFTAEQEKRIREIMREEALHLTHEFYQRSVRAMRRSIPDVRPETDLLRLFLNDCTKPEEGATVQSSELYEAFVRWCRDKSRGAWSHRAFSRAMNDAGYAKVVRDSVRWVDLRVREEGEAA